MSAADADASWTLERVERAAPELSELVRVHRVLAEATARSLARGPAVALHPAISGTPALHWIHGRPLLDAADPAPLAAPVAGMVVGMARALSDVFPATAAAVEEMLAATAAREFGWRDRIAGFRSVPPEPVPHPALFRFLLLRAMAVPAAHLARSVSAPPPERWVRAACPWCGVPAAAAVARSRAGRTLLCILCGGRWESREAGCFACGEQRPEQQLVVASREAGPASLEGCATCHAALKLFASGDVGTTAPLALEVLTVRLDVAAEHTHGLMRDETARAAVFPPP